MSHTTLYKQLNRHLKRLDPNPPRDDDQAQLLDQIAALAHLAARSRYPEALVPKIKQLVQKL